MWNSRLEFLEKHYYHVCNYWFDKHDLFKDGSDFEKIYKIVSKYSADYKKNIKLISYCYLPNHFHFVFYCLETWFSVSDFMRKVQLSYAIYLKNKYLDYTKWQPIFNWRFKSKMLEWQDYLYKTIAYVNYNPVKHKLVEDIKDYKYTSYHKILNKETFQKYIDVELLELE